MAYRNRYLEALKENVNLVGLATTAAVSAAMLNPLPLLIGAVVEAAYLVFVPDTKWYEARLSQKLAAAAEADRKQFREKVIPAIDQRMRTRFERLQKLRDQVGAQGLADAPWPGELLQKLDYLLERFLLFAEKDAQFRHYLRSVQEQLDEELRPGPSGNAKQQWYANRPPVASNRNKNHAQPPARRGAAANSTDAELTELVAEIQEAYDQEIATLQAARPQETDADTQAVLEKRIQVLQRRREFVGKITKIITNLSHQLDLVEDTFGLINDEICAHSPEQILADIEDVVEQAEFMSKSLEEVAPYDQMLARIVRTT